FKLTLCSNRMETRDIPPAAPAPSASARRGRPRSEEADRAILRAATELLAQPGPERAAAGPARAADPPRAQPRIMRRRPIARGQLPADTDTEVALDLLY